MRYLVIRKQKSEEAIGIVKIPKNRSVHYMYGHEPTKIYTCDITESEYTSYKVLGLFSEYIFHIAMFGQTVAYDPKLYKVNGRNKIVKRGKREQREERKRNKQERGKRKRGKLFEGFMGDV